MCRNDFCVRYAFLLAVILILFAPPCPAWEGDLGVNDLIGSADGYIPKTVILADGLGGWYVVWLDESGVFEEIHAQRLDADGNPLWAEGGVWVVVSIDNIVRLAAVADKDGDLFVAYCAGVYDPRVYVQKVAPDGSRPWGSQSGLAATVGAGSDQGELDLVADDQGGVIVGFTDHRNMMASQTDIWAQRFDTDGTRLWGTAGTVVTEAANDQNGVAVVLSEPGQAMFFWTDWRDFATNVYDIYGQRLDANGHAQWGADGRTICALVETQSLTDAVPDGFGGAFIAWEDQRNGNGDIVVQRVHPAGWDYWMPTSGLPVCTNDEHQDEAYLSPDGIGGVCVIWEDNRIDAYESVTVYGQYIQASGLAMWAEDGIPIIASQTMTLLSGDPIAHDGQDGWFVLAGTLDMRTQRMDEDGSRTWAFEGLPVTTASYYAAGPSIVADGRGGMIAVWIDRRLGMEYAVYTQRLDRWGYPGDAGPGLYEVIDRPGDQGGEAVVSWTPSYLDTYADPVIDHYSVWMRYAGGAKAAVPAAAAPVAATGLFTDDIGAQLAAGWVYAGQQDAWQFDDYGFHAATYGDSTETSLPLTEYKVLAHDLDTGNFWESTPLSGYSLDNLTPGVPLALAAERVSVDVELAWDASGIDDEDVAEYRVYRSTMSGFAPDESTFIGTAADTTYLDVGQASGPLYYLVSAVDIHDNESGPSNEAAVSSASAVSGPGVPTTFALHAAVPNPFNPQTVITYDLPRRLHVRLRIFDLRGRLVRTLIEGWRDGPLRHETTWDGRDEAGRAVESGVYFYRLQADRLVRTGRMALVR